MGQNVQFVHIRINCCKKAIEYVWILTAIVPRNPTLVVKKLLALLYGIRGWIGLTDTKLYFHALIFSPSQVPFVTFLKTFSVL